ncbi:unnamed protein product, partial [Ixodes persulcatus]
MFHCSIQGSTDQTIALNTVIRAKMLQVHRPSTTNGIDRHAVYKQARVCPHQVWALRVRRSRIRVK